MDLTQLQLFRAIADEGSITAAAARLHRVPSNLTTRIRQLEQELGVDLFIREKLRLRLSPAGHNFLGYARKILDLADEARHSVSDGVPQGHFPLGSLESTAAVRIPSLLAAYHRQYPQVELDLSTGPSGEMIEEVLSGKRIAAFVDAPLPHPLLDGFAVFNEEMVLIAPGNHAKVQRARDVSGKTIYAFRANCSYRRHFENWFIADGAVPGKILEMESYHGMLACVSAGAGLAMMPLSMLQSMPGSSDVQTSSLAAPFRHLQTSLIWRRDTHSPNLNALIAMTKERLHAANAVPESV